MGKIVSYLYKKQHFLIACLLIMTSNFLFSQSTISGFLKDSTSLPAYGVNVLLFKSDTLIKFTNSDNSGYYKLDNLKSDVYRLELTSLSYHTISKTINLKKDENLDFILVDKISALDEVTIEVERDIEVRNDTIIFRAEAFNNRKDIVVEDLLKNIPGIEIDVDGTIKFQGKLVTNVKVDNDDLFDGGYAVLTKNLNADVVDKVQVLQNYSRNPLLKSVRDTQDVAINLTLKEDRKSNLFGNMSLGLATETRHDFNTNLISLLKKSKHYLFSDFNNIGDDVVANINNILSTKNDDKSYNLGFQEKSVSFLNINTIRPIFDDRIVNINNSKFGNINSIFNLAENFKLKATGLIFSDRKNYISNNETNYLIEDSFQINERFNTVNKDEFALGSVSFEWDINKKNRLEYKGSYFFIDTNGNSNIFQNEIDIDEKLNTITKSHNHFIHYTKRLTDSSAFVIAAKYIDETKPQTYSITPYLYGDFFEDANNNATSTNADLNNRLRFSNIQATYFNNKKSFNTELHLGYKSRIDDLNSTLFFLDTQSNQINANEDFLNNLNFNTNSFYLNSRLRKTFNKIDAFVNTNVNYEKLIYNEANTNFSSTFLYVDSDFNLKFKPNSKHEFISGFMINNNTNRLNNVFGQYIPINYRTFLRGNTSNELLKSYSAYFNYIYGNWSDKFTLSINSYYLKNKDYFSTNSNVSVQLNTIEQLILNNGTTFSLGLNADRYLDFISSNLKLKSNITSSSYGDFVNDIERNINTTRFIYGFELRTVFKGNFNIIAGTEWNHLKFEINNSSDTNTNNKSFIDLDLKVSDFFDITLKNDRYQFGNLPNSKNSFYFSNLNAQLRFKESKFSTFFRINNLFNNKSFNIYSLTDITEFTSNTQLIPRYYMFGLNYRF